MITNIQNAPTSPKIGAGSGINSSANSLALNTYFKEKRRIATGLSWTLTGMGPILMPQIIASLLPMFGVQGCLLIFTGIALNAAVCALIFQPVQWHMKSRKNNDTESKSAPLTPIPHECDYCRMTKRRSRKIISSQYLYNADDAHTTGYEIIDPGLPMLSLANDGWSSKRSLYGSRSSLYSDRASRFSSRKPSSQNLTSLNRSSSVNLAGMKDREKRKISAEKIEEHPEDGSSSGHVSRENVEAAQPQIIQTPNTVSIDTPTYETNVANQNQTTHSNNKSQNSPRRKISTSNTFNMEKEVLKTVSQKLEEFVATGDRVPTLLSLDKYCTCDEKLRLHLEPQWAEELNKEVIEDDMKQHSLWQKIVIFFDLNLLRDFTYVNLMIGVTLGNEIKQRAISWSVSQRLIHLIKQLKAVA